MGDPTSARLPPELDQSEYHYSNSDLGHAHSYILPELIRILKLVAKKDSPVFEVGAGNGSIANALSEYGYVVTSVEPSRQGLNYLNQKYPHLKVYEGSGYDDLSERFGTYPVVISLEVIEHVYAPRLFARQCFKLVDAGGKLILSTPYHGYWKNLALAFSGKLDAHFSTLWDHGHIKFWSIRTLRTLLEEVGFQKVTFRRVGRIPPLAKTMIAVAHKPS